MRKLSARLALFIAGIAVGAFLMSAQQPPAPALRLSHVGIYVKDYDESLRYYTQILGLREAFTIKDAAGKPTLTYVQITRDTFIELQPATADRPVGLSHIGIWPENLTTAIAQLRLRGLKIDDAKTGSTKTSITNVTDPNGVRLELLDFLPGSLPRQAIDNFK
jgi:catechol 2,3-dioxygenase-like lactoylglutathione lyase family enzyme